MKLNIGAGHRRIPGWTGVDAVAGREGVDIVSDARSIPLPDCSVDAIMAIHLVEHFYKWEVPAALAEWYRLLRPLGMLYLELPDIVKACRNVLEDRATRGKPPEQLGMWGIYGDPRLSDPYMNHKWGWTFRTLSEFVSAAGFTEIVERPTQFHPVGKDLRDFRLEAQKL